MKKSKKRILGLVGLILVIATTIFAAFLPNPEAQAVESHTSTATVRVTSETSSLAIIEPKDGTVFVTPNQTFSFDYEKIGEAVIEVEYKDKEGNTNTYNPDSFDLDYGTDTKQFDVNLLDTYGYGEYTLHIRGDGYGLENIAEDSVKFSFYPVVADFVDDGGDDSFTVNLDYDTENNDKTIKVNIYDENGNLVDEITVKFPETKIVIKPGEKDLPTGDYKVEIVTYDNNGEALYSPYTLYFHYESPAKVPNTGTLFANFNISKKDWIITVVFVSLALITTVIIVAVKKKKKTK